MTKLECCVESIASARAAVEGGGCTRLELCSSLVEGGVTPSIGLFTQIRRMFSSKQVFLGVLVRPRAGDDFAYDEDELGAMLCDIEEFKRCGADGVVIGVLKHTSTTTIDSPAMQRLIAAARPMEVTFHRAIDMCSDPVLAVRECAALGVDRILSSGGERTALLGVHTLASMVREAAAALTTSRMVICAGGGVSETNCVDILRQSGVHQLHGSLRETTPPRNNPKFTLSAEDAVLQVTSASRVRAVLTALMNE